MSYKKREVVGQDNVHNTIPQRVTEDEANNENSGVQWNWHHRNLI